MFSVFLLSLSVLESNLVGFVSPQKKMKIESHFLGFACPLGLG